MGSNDVRDSPVLQSRIQILKGGDEGERALEDVRPMGNTFTLVEISDKSRVSDT